MSATIKNMGPKTSSLSTLLLSALTIFLTCQDIFAQSPQGSWVDAQYLTFLSGATLRQQERVVLDQFLQNLNFTVEHLDIPAELPISVDQIEIQIRPGSPQVRDSVKGLQLESQGSSVAVRLGQIAVHQTIQQNLGGVIVNLQVDARCQGVELQASDPNSLITASFEPYISGEEIKVQVLEPRISLGSPELQIGSLQCSGAQGFDHLIKAGLIGLLHNTTALNQLVNSKITAYLQESMAKLSYRWNEPRQIISGVNPAGISAWIFPSSLQILPSGTWQSLGVVRFVLPGAGLENKGLIPLPAVDFSNLASENNFIMAEQTMARLLEAYLSPQHWRFDSVANDISGFAKLLRSRFLQFFLWPDLMKWPKSTRFPLITTMAFAPQVSWSKGNSLTLKATLKVDLLAETTAFMHFKVPLSSQVDLISTADKLSVKPSQTALKLSYQFDPSYCQQGSGRCGYLASSLIRDSVQDYFNQGLSFDFPLPTLTSLGGRQLKATQLSRHPELKAFVITFRDQ